MIIRFDGTEIGGNYIAGIVKNAKVYDGVFKLGSTICETYKLSINKDGISSIPQVVTISTNEYTLSGGNHLYIEGATTDDLVDYSVDGATEQDGTPTPNSPVEVKTIPTIINLFNSDTYPVSETKNGITCTNNGDGTFTLNGTATSNNFSFQLGDNNTIKKYSATSSITQTIYYISGSCTKANPDTVRPIIRLDYNNSNSFIHPEELSTLNKIISKTMPSRPTSTSFSWSINIGVGDVFDNLTLRYQVELGNTANPYVPYGYWNKIKITGNNIFNQSNTSWYRNNGSAFVSTANTNTTRIRTNSFEIEGGKTYTLSGIPEDISFLLVSEYNEYGGTRASYIYPENNSFTLAQSTKYVNFIFGGSNFTDDTNTLMANANIQLEENNQATSYEPYKENQVLIDMSKPNLFDSSNYNTFSGYLNGSNVITTLEIQSGIYIPCKPNKTYTVVKENTGTNNRFCVFTTDVIPVVGVTALNYIGTRSGGDNKEYYSITTPSTAKYLCVFMRVASTTPTLDEILSSIKIYESNNPTPYYELCETPDGIKDILTIYSNGNCTINKKVGKRIFNGGETWEVQWNSSGKYGYRTPIDNMKIITSASQNSYLYSNYYSSYSPNDLFRPDPSFYGICKRNSQSQVIVRYDEKTTVNDLKTWLSTHNTDVYYEYATPETITLPNATIQLFEGINHITFVNDLETGTTIVHKTPIKTLYATDYDDKNDFTYEIQTEDAMTKFNFKYDASPIMTHTKTVGEETINYAYLSEILDDICTKAGVTNGISSFYQDDMEVSWYNDTYMARDYLGFIGEINGKNLCISPRNELVFKVIKTTPTKSINFNNVSDFKIGAEHTITRVVWDNGINKWEYGNETGETYYINTDNVYVIDTSIVEHIYNEINGLDYYNFKTTNCPLDGLKIGDIVRFTDGTNNYDTFTQFNNASFSKDSWFGGIELNVDSEAKQETQVLGQKENIKEIKQTLDRTNNTVSTLVTETGEISTAVETLQTNTYTKTQVQKIVDGTGVDGVKVTKVETISGTFDIDGMHYAKSGAETESTINQYGVDVTRTEDDEQLLFAGYDTTLKKAIVTSEHLITRRYLSIGENSRLQDYKTGGGVWVI